MAITDPIADYLTRIRNFCGGHGVSDEEVSSAQLAVRDPLSFALHRFANRQDNWNRPF